MPKLIDLTRKRFGHWTVLALHPERYPGHTRWLCRCACGIERAVFGGALRRGASKSCGGCGRLKHGHCRNGRPTRVYETWHSMMQRCCNPNHRAYANYGGRGIRVCGRWHSFVNFLVDMGEPPPGLSIDRINNDDDYSPSNTRWTTRSVQQRNQRRRKESKLRIKRGDPKILAGLKQLTESFLNHERKEKHHERQRVQLQRRR
jgi:pentatricopeptide repeat protein